MHRDTSTRAHAEPRSDTDTFLVKMRISQRVWMGSVAVYSCTTSSSELKGPIDRKQIVPNLGESTICYIGPRISSLDYCLIC